MPRQMCVLYLLNIRDPSPIHSKNSNNLVNKIKLFFKSKYLCASHNRSTSNISFHTMLLASSHSRAILNSFISPPDINKYPCCEVAGLVGNVDLGSGILISCSNE
jgi:hypothetical protein